MPLIVFTGGRVLVQFANATPEYSSALAIEIDRVVALGDDALRLLADRPDATRIDLAGGTLAPAVGDGHAHPMQGELEANGPQIRSCSSIEEIQQAVRVWHEAHPDADWIVGASYDSTITKDGAFDAHWLDEVTGDTPTILRAFDYHTAWVNSAALKAGAITAETPDPQLGRIDRREDGSPLGTLREAAANNFLENTAPPISIEDRMAAIEAATKRYAAMGATWVQDAWVEPWELEAYIQAAVENRLHARINLALRADPKTWRDQVDAFVEARERVNQTGNSRLTASTVKFFLDGVVESHTAAMLEPYADRETDRGLANWTVDDLHEACSAFASQGFQLHLHAIGDGANRMALDVVEATQARHGKPPVPHVIAHVAVLEPSDVQRFAELDVIANFEPYWAQCDAVMQTLTIPHLGHPRDTWQYLIGSVRSSGATVSFGSDWPVTTADWRAAMSVAITRTAPTEDGEESWLPDERISAAEALAGYTSGIARQSGGALPGKLTVGSIADAVWLSQDPLKCAPRELPAIEVKGTWLAGEVIFSK